MLLQPPLGASVVDLAAAGEEEGDGVGRVGPRGRVEGGQQSSNLWSVDFFTKSKRPVTFAEVNAETKKC